MSKAQYTNGYIWVSTSLKLSRCSFRCPFLVTCCLSQMPLALVAKDHKRKTLLHHAASSGRAPVVDEVTRSLRTMFSQPDQANKVMMLIFLPIETGAAQMARCNTTNCRDRKNVVLRCRGRDSRFDRRVPRKPLLMSGYAQLWRKCCHVAMLSGLSRD